MHKFSLERSIQDGGKTGAKYTKYCIDKRHQIFAGAMGEVINKLSVNN
jgi:hypothetical protein